MTNFLSKHISALAILAMLSVGTVVGVTAINNNTATEFLAQTTGVNWYNNFVVHTNKIILQLLNMCKT